MDLIEAYFDDLRLIKEGRLAKLKESAKLEKQVEKLKKKLFECS